MMFLTDRPPKKERSLSDPMGKDIRSEWILKTVAFRSDQTSRTYRIVFAHMASVYGDQNFLESVGMSICGIHVYI